LRLKLFCFQYFSATFTLRNDCKWHICDIQSSDISIFGIDGILTLSEIYDAEMGLVCDVFWRCTSSWLLHSEETFHEHSPASLITCSVSLSFVSVIVSLGRSVSARQRSSERKRKWPALGFCWVYELAK